MVRRTLANAVLVVSLAAPVLAQEGPLAAARDLYSAARYDEALAMLNGLRPQESGNPVAMRAIEQYRSLCLLALGRGSEAEAAIAAVVAADPMYLPTETEASPRVRSAFSEVRQRQLPDIARARYASAKSAFDRKDYQAAEQQFRELLRLIDDPDMGGRLGDLRVLVSGFVDLSSASAPPPAPEPRPEPRREDPPPAAAPATSAAPAAPDAQRIFSGDDEGVSMPTAIRQDVPRVPAQIASQTRDRGLLDVTIDEQGRVIQAKLRVSLHPIYDAQLLAATRDWRYQPAIHNGRPVKFRKMIQITVTK
ncbi:MAG TPA: energy transducer TonB [Vicinamibacterales bacterium]|nr:energy transducer TonB [Vicinamibacterales bacterium]